MPRPRWRSRGRRRRGAAVRPVLALLTDFGSRDPYVGAMKGAALQVCPELTLVDLTHEIAPHDVGEAARHLAAAAPYFPAGTAFVAVVDPGVGTARRALAARVGPHWFLAPDNGLLSAVLAARPPSRGSASIVEIRDPRYQRPVVSRTFEGRDRFAPAAAWLLRGVPLDALGPRVLDPCRIGLPQAVVRDDRLIGTLVGADRFGNVLTSIDRASWDAFAAGGPVTIALAGARLRLVDTYAAIGDGEVAALFGSTGVLEVAARSVPALGRAGVQPGAPIEVARLPDTFVGGAPGARGSIA
jgi:S-adenosyl-L-methionine hydrolase (adenosine-forming)